MEELKRDFSDKAVEDFRLIDEAVGGEDKAYAKLLQRYKRPVYHMILKMVRNVDDAEDLTIESFAKAFRSLHRFKKDFTFSTWLFRIATNNTIDFIRKKKLNTLSIENTFTDDDGQSVSIDVEDENLNPQEEAIKLQKSELIQMLNSQQRVEWEPLKALFDASVAKAAANWIINELFGRLTKEGKDIAASPVSARRTLSPWRDCTSATMRRAALSDASAGSSAE